MTQQATDLINKRGIDKTFWVLFGALIVAAAIALFSASSTLVYKSGSALSGVGQQLIFIALGVLVAFVLQYLPSRAIRFGGYFVLAIAIALCVSTLFPSLPWVKTINGASRWVKIGVQFQPSELAKLSLVIVVADLLSRVDRKDEDSFKRIYWWVIGISAVTILPIMHGNLSTAILMGGVIVLMLFLARFPWKYILWTIVVPVVGLFLLLLVAKYAYIDKHKELPHIIERTETWVSRIDAFIGSDSEQGGQTIPWERMNAEQRKKEMRKEMTSKEGMQRAYAQLAVNRGGKTPIGVGPGNSKERDYLPFAYADYIFAIIVEESGVIGAFLLGFLYLAILFRACYVSSRFDDYAAMLMVMGVALMLTCQAIISMLVAVGLGPVTGQPLPLISRGGTSALLTSLYFGIMMCVSREQLTRRKRIDMTARDSAAEVPDVVVLDDK